MLCFWYFVILLHFLLVFLFLLLFSLCFSLLLLLLLFLLVWWSTGPGSGSCFMLFVLPLVFVFLQVFAECFFLLLLKLPCFGLVCFGSFVCHVFNFLHVLWLSVVLQFVSLLLVFCFSWAVLLFLFRFGVASFVCLVFFLLLFLSFSCLVFPAVFATFHPELHITNLIAVSYNNKILITYKIVFRHQIL